MATRNIISVLCILYLALSASGSSEKLFRVKFIHHLERFSENRNFHKKIVLAEKYLRQGYTFTKFKLIPEMDSMVSKHRLKKDSFEFVLRAKKSFVQESTATATAIIWAKKSLDSNQYGGSEENFALNWLEPGQEWDFKIDPLRPVRNISVIWTDAGGDATGQLTINGKNYAKKKIGSNYNGAVATWNINGLIPENARASIRIEKDKAKIYRVDIQYFDQSADMDQPKLASAFENMDDSRKPVRKSSFSALENIFRLAEINGELPENSDNPQLFFQSENSDTPSLIPDVQNQQPDNSKKEVNPVQKVYRYKPSVPALIQGQVVKKMNPESG